VELKFDPKNPKYQYITEDSEIENSLEKLEKESIIAIDLESTGFDPYTSKVLLIQLGTPEISYIFDARVLHLKENERFKALMENPKTIKLMQNGKFDYGFLKYHFGIEIANIFDVMLAEGILTAGLKGSMGLISLRNLVSQYLETDLEKETRKTFENYTGKITEQQLIYSALDTLMLFPIFEQQVEKLKNEQLVNIAKLEFAVTRVVAEMELRGIFINVSRWRDIIASLKEKRNKYAYDFQESIRQYYATNGIDLFGNSVDAININSQVQLMDLFNNRLGLDVPSTGDNILATIEHPVAKILRDYRGYEKLISAFGESLLEKVNKVTGRLHPDFIQLGAATGRFSCQNPNLQQIPRNSEEAPFRECFIPAPGYKLVVTDYSSMEMRILADVSGDQKLIQAVNDSDVHSFTAALMFNKEYSADFKKKYPDLRQAAKIINFGLMYGMGPGSLARQIGVTPEVGKEYLDKYFKIFPHVRSFLDTVAKNAVSKGWSKTPAGRKRWYNIPDKSEPDYNRRISQIQREAKNHPIQGTNADVTKYALVFMKDRLKKEGVDGFVTHTVHDEVVCEVREDQAQDWSLLQQEEMIRAGELIIKKVPVKSEPFVGDVWEH